MILPGNTVLSLLIWIAERFGLVLDLRDEQAFDSLDEGEISSELHYGRD